MRAHEVELARGETFDPVGIRRGGPLGDGRRCRGVLDPVEVVEDAARLRLREAREEVEEQVGVQHLVAAARAEELELEHGDRDRVGRLPGRGRLAEELEGQEPRVERHLLDEGVHPVAIGLERAPVPPREPRELPPELLWREAVAAHDLVHEQEVRPQHLGEPPRRRAAQDVHLEEAVLGLRVAIAVGAALERAGAAGEEVGHAVGVRTMVTASGDAIAAAGRPATAATSAIRRAALGIWTGMLGTRGTGSSADRLAGKGAAGWPRAACPR